MTTTQDRQAGITRLVSEWDIEQVYEAYRKPIHSYLYSLLDSPEQAEDATQETFLKAFKALARMTGPLTMSAWLYRIAHNVATDELRRRQLIYWHSLEAREYETREIAGAAGEEPEAKYNGPDETVWAALAGIDTRYRQALVLYYMFGLTSPEIAQVLHVMPSGMKMFLARARRRFRAQYSEAEREEAQA